MYLKYFKPILDRSLAAMLLLLSIPVLIPLILLVRLLGTDDIFYTQQRTGLHGKPFTVFKFKTMTDERDENGDLLPEEKRLTWFGNLLRKSSLDELPQLVNILRGEMSVIGPRPLLPEYLPLYNEHHQKRHLVKPGLTGWSQVNGRNSINWTKKLDLDVEYVDNLSWRIDLKIVLRTILKILTPDGVNHAKMVGMPRFAGYGHE